MKLYKMSLSLLLCGSLALTLLLSGCVSEQQVSGLSAEQKTGGASEPPEPASGDTIVDNTGS